jgi:pectate lyase
MKTSTFNSKKKNIRLLFTGLTLVLASSWAFSQTIATPDGYAAYAGTTGGGNATPITVSSASEFSSAVSGSSSAVIYVNGFLNVGNVSIGSNKTIVGLSESSGIGGGTISVNGSNYIFQNLIIGPSSGDVMEISGGTKVFITKCSFHDAGDEILSIVRQADYVTVSWCKFYFDNTHSHAYGHLIGNSDNATGDRGKLHTTMHHNWYDDGVRGRMPRVRFGNVHIYNNYYNSSNTSYCVGVGKECHIRLENTHFDNVEDPWADYGGSSDGEIGWSGLKFEGVSQPTFMSNSYPVFSPPYSYNLDPVDNVESLVKAGAGNVLGGVVYNNPPSVSITSPSNGASFDEPASITISASASDSDGSVSKVEFYQGSTSLGTDYSSPYSITWSNVAAGSYSLTAIATDNDGSSTTSSAVNVNVSGNGNNNGGDCDNPVTISIPFSKNGSGEFCWKTSDDISTINSWNLEKLQINGVDYTNTWSSSMPAKQDGFYYIEYVGNYDWSHFEAASVKSADGFKNISENDLYYYPNPVEEMLNIQFATELSEGVEIQLVDFSGKILHSNNTKSNKYIVDMSVCPEGLYILKVFGKNTTIYKTIVKQ